MGIVYLAREVRLDRLVALKLLPPHLAAQPALRERFLREARTAGGLSHPNIVPIHAVDDVAGFVFYAMAYVRGQTLALRIETGGRLQPTEATRLLREVAWALAYAHAQGVVHRDVKPENILLEEGTGRALVADFGIARLAQASGGTGVGEVLGTPEYMSPEQAAGEAVDGRSDLYSLGAVAFAALSGRPPFQAPTAAALLAKHLTEAPPALGSVARGLPAPLCRAVDRCLAKNPSQRFTTGEELAEALAAALESRPEIPVPVRVFLRRLGQEQQGFAGGSVILTAMFLPSLIAFAVSRLGTAGGVLLAVGAFLVTLSALYGAFTLPRLRKLQRLGYGAADIESAVTIELKRRQEELEFEYGPRPVEYLNLASSSGIVVFVIGVITAVRQNGFGVPVALLGVLLSWLGLRRASEQRDFNATLRARFWSSRFAKWMFRVAGKGLDVHPAVVASRPTELAIGSAAEVLFAALPRDARRQLGDVPAVLRRLEDHAQTMRRRLEELESSLADAVRGPRASVAGVERTALVADLRTARDRTQERLTTVVAMLETIRLDLVRLRARAGTMAGITEDLNKAREISDETGRLIEAKAEVEALLR